MEITGIITNPTCGGSQGSIVTSLSTNENVTYSWSTGATTPNINNLVAGVYTVTVTSVPSGCVTVRSFTLESDGDLSISLNPTNPTCPGAADGVVSVNPVFTGTGSLAYSWSTGQTTPTISNLPAGDYCVTVTSTDGCVDIACTTLAAPTAVGITGVITNPVCAGSQGSIITSLSTNANVSYSWSTGATTANLDNLVAGVYTVTVTTVPNGCVTIESFTLVDQGDLSISLNPTNPVCAGVNNGTISINTSSTGIGTLAYSWSTGQTTPTISNLPAGDYCVTVTSSQGCVDIACVTLTAPAMVGLTGTITNPICDGAQGSIVTSLSTNANVTYSWSTGATTANLNNLVAGVYTVTVTTVPSGCVTVESFTLVSQGDLSISLDPTNPICNGADNGMVSINTMFTGIGTGSGSLVYSWNTGQTTQTITDLPSGQYCVTVTSNEGCVDNACVTLTAPNAINANAVIIAAGCGTNNGKIKLDVSGGTAPLSFKWDNGAVTQDIENLAPGVYCVVICDALGCTFTDCFTVLGGTNFNSLVSTAPITCPGDINGSATVSVNGGTAPFTYAWNTGATTQSISNLPAGNYCVTVTDALGCASIACGDVAPAVALNISTTSTNTTCGANNGSAAVTADFAIASVLWTGVGISATTSTIQNLAAGTYTVVVTSQNGCTLTETVNIGNSSPLVISLSPTTTTICPGETVVLSASSNSANTTFTYTATGGTFGSNTGSSNTYTMMSPGTFTITLSGTTNAGCTDQTTATVIVRDNDDPICNPNMDLVNIGNFVWFDINNNGIQDPLELGIEGVEVKLLTAGPDGIFYTGDDVMVRSVFTDPSGFYMFANVAAGDYIIMFCIDTLPGTEFTSQNTGNNDGIDSDASPLNGKTDPFTIIAGQNDDLSFDAGIILSPTGCDNIIDAGEICCDQVICGSGTTPDLITNVTLPSGGSGAIEYIWMSTTVGGPFNINTWNLIPGATGPEYQPGPIGQTTFVARCARRAGCTTYFETSIIKLELAPSPVVNIESLPAFICVGELDDFNATNAGIGATYSWDLGDGAIPATATGRFLTDISWSTPGAKVITLKTTLFGCTFTMVRNVQVGSCSQGTQNRFMDFTAISPDESMDVDLNWTTNEDMNDFTFIIEHSTIGVDYDVLYTMDGNDAFESKKYSFKDIDARAGRNYYRIKHVNTNGQVEISEERMIILSDDVDKFILFPNPTVDYVIFESLRLSDEEGLIVVSDMKGQIIKQVVIPPNTRRLSIDLSEYSAGLYTIYTKYIDIKSVPEIIFKSEK